MGMSALIVVLGALSDIVANVQGESDGIAVIDIPTRRVVAQFDVDGAIAAICRDLGLPPAIADALFIISRVPGIAAHAWEERERQAPMREIDPKEHLYDGPSERRVPERRKYDADLRGSLGKTKRGRTRIFQDNGTRMCADLSWPELNCGCARP
jgi:hypothetical protein